MMQHRKHIIELPKKITHHANSIRQKKARSREYLMSGRIIIIIIIIIINEDNSS